MRQKLGQHFLVDEEIVSRIMHVIAPAPSDTLLEIGPGQGVLTKPLLAQLDDGILEAVEIDSALAEHLQDDIGERAQWRLHKADIMAVDFDTLAAAGERGRRIVGNLPYQISGPLLMRLITTPNIRDMHFMLQLEVAERLCADVGASDYSALSVLVGARAECVKLFDVEPNAFNPPPEVRSAFVRLVPKSPPLVGDELWGAFEKLVRAAFTKRRKKLKHALDGYVSVAQIEALQIDPHCRPQSLDLDSYVRLARACGKE